MKKLLCLFMSIIFICFIIYTSISSHSSASNISKGKEYYYNNDILLNEDGTTMKTTSNSSIITNADTIDTVKDSITVLVNKEFALPSDYIPSDLVVPDILFNINYYDEKKLMRQEAATAIEELFHAAAEAGLNLYGISGYRSYNRQKEIYDTNVATKGEEYTNRYSARPGHSEHQTGLVMDVSTNSIGNQLEPVFAYTPEGRWLAENAHLYGFIIRYPEGKESITGYSYEPWHIRYVGRDLAEYLYENNITLEEYYNYTPSDIDTHEFTYDNVIDIDKTNQKKDTVPPTQKEIDDLEKKTQKEKEDLETSESKEPIKDTNKNPNTKNPNAKEPDTSKTKPTSKNPNEDNLTAEDIITDDTSQKDDSQNDIIPPKENDSEETEPTEPLPNPDINIEDNIETPPTTEEYPPIQ